LFSSTSASQFQTSQSPGEPQLKGPAKHYLFTDAQVRQLAKSNSYNG
jgi:hypothetical protein